MAAIKPPTSGELDLDPLSSFVYDSVSKDPMGGLAPMPGVVWAGRFGHSAAKQAPAIEGALNFLRERIPSFMKKADQYNVRVTPGHPRVKHLDSEMTPLGKGLDAEIKIPSAVINNPQDLQRDLFHELAHLVAGNKWLTPTEAMPGVLNRVYHLLRPMAQKAMKTIPQSEFDTVMRNPGVYSGPDLLEELAIRMMENNVARKRLMP